MLPKKKARAAVSVLERKRDEFEAVDMGTSDGGERRRCLLCLRHAARDSGRAEFYADGTA
ncbi:hypothetical protein JCM10599A_18650 [Paraburkholderia kururiensis]